MPWLVTRGIMLLTMQDFKVSKEFNISQPYVKVLIQVTIMGRFYTVMMRTRWKLKEALSKSTISLYQYHGYW